MGSDPVADFVRLAAIPPENVSGVEEFLRRQESDSSNTLAVLEVFKRRPWPLILGGHTHVAEKVLYRTDRGLLRFEQSAAIVGPNDYGPVIMPSGFSLYTVNNGVIDAGTFVPLTMPRQ